MFVAFDTATRIDVRGAVRVKAAKTSGLARKATIGARLSSPALSPKQSTWRSLMKTDVNKTLMYAEM
jgi:hypothetical protein